ncbi:MAG: V8-like Glu-specific endopeptidase [Flavobacteriales bacterium]|jgi:V8-like Glu-specific endopeptidase
MKNGLNLFNRSKKIELKTLIAGLALTATSLVFANENPNFLSKLENPAGYSKAGIMNIPEAICGTDDLQHVEQYDDRYSAIGYNDNFVQAMSASVGAMKSIASDSASGYCSGTLISADQFITASHCVDSNTVGEFVTFGYQEQTPGILRNSQQHFEILEVVEDGADFGLDYAVLRLAGSPGTVNGSFPGADGTAIGWKGVSGELPVDAVIIQHPLGQAKQVDAGSGISYSTGRIRYSDIDTQPGSSGSGVLNDLGQVIGVHTNGGCTTSSGSNSGVFMQDILDVSGVLGTTTLGFEEDITWAQSGTRDWLRRSGSTPSSSTGPNSAANGNSYAYIETSGSSAGATAILTSPEINGSDLVLTFSYHMYGSDIGTLSVDVWDGSRWINNWWERTNKQHNSNGAAWSAHEVDLKYFAGPIKLRFRATAQADGGYKGDIAIDDIEVKSGAVTKATITNARMWDANWAYMQWLPVDGITNYTQFIIGDNSAGRKSLYNYTPGSATRGDYLYAYYHKNVICNAFGSGTFEMSAQLWAGTDSSKVTNYNNFGSLTCP